MGKDRHLGMKIYSIWIKSMGEDGHLGVPVFASTATPSPPLRFCGTFQDERHSIKNDLDWRLHYWYTQASTAIHYSLCIHCHSASNYHSVLSLWFVYPNFALHWHMLLFLVFFVSNSLPSVRLASMGLDHYCKWVHLTSIQVPPRAFDWHTLLPLLRVALVATHACFASHCCSNGRKSRPSGLQFPAHNLAEFTIYAMAWFLLRQSRSFLFSRTPSLLRLASEHLFFSMLLRSSSTTCYHRHREFPCAECYIWV